MQFTVCVLGLELLSVHVSTDEDTADDEARDLSGGELAGRSIEAGEPDLNLGFTNGREVE